MSPVPTSANNVRDLVVSENEFAQVLGITPRTLRRWHALRIGPPRIQIEKQIFYSRASLVDWMNQHEQKPVRSFRSRSGLTHASTAHE